ncbi:hypothetical protein [Lactobacillus sp. PV037]|nr:hypothetical protein [Lactobacillus sp. PV037]
MNKEVQGKNNKVIRQDGSDVKATPNANNASRPKPTFKPKKDE